MNDAITPGAPRRRPHPAARARNATLALSLGAFGAITGGLAAHAASSTQAASKTQTAASNTTATTSAVTSDDNSTTTSDDSTAGVPASNLSSGTAVTSSHGS